ncbi:MAG: response regulator [Lachnospiraceae bacterium]|nr:response regulator [Lachnospiraceae bacterium]
MSVFIAVLDDDPADRKQSERLLSRERDERIKNGEVIYYDSYGSEEALLPYFMKYDLFLIDVTTTTRDGMMVAVDLLRRGAEGKIVLYYDKIDYRAKYGDEEGISFMPKPLWQRDFSKLIDEACSAHKNRKPRVELRGEKGTEYVTNDEILYAVPRDYYVAVALSGDRVYHAMTDMSSFYASLDQDEFLVLSGNRVVNMGQVVSVNGNSFRMPDGAVIRFGLLEKKSITRKYAEYAERKNK